jgi:DNA-binding transcriptional LysR family regulator
VEFYQLETFIAVVEERSFSRAAERVFRTQSAVSQAIKRLEEILEVPLIDRRSTTLEPTEAGEVLLDHARKIVALREQSLNAIADLKDARAGKLTIAAHESAANYVLPPLVRAFHRESPGVQIEVRRESAQRIPKQVLGGHADFGFVTQRPPSRELQSIELFRDPLVLIVPPGHRLAGEESVRIEDLGDEEFVVHHVRTPTTEQVLMVFEKAAVPYCVAARLWGYEDIKEFVRRGLAIAGIPRMCVQEELRQGSLVELNVAGLDFYRTIRLVYRSESYLSEGGQRLLDLTREWDWPELVPEPTVEHQQL